MLEAARPTSTCIYLLTACVQVPTSLSVGMNPEDKIELVLLLRRKHCSPVYQWEGCNCKQDRSVYLITTIYLGGKALLLKRFWSSIFWERLLKKGFLMLNLGNVCTSIQRKEVLLTFYVVTHIEICWGSWALNAGLKKFNIRSKCQNTASASNDGKKWFGAHLYFKIIQCLP